MAKLYRISIIAVSLILFVVATGCDSGESVAPKGINEIVSVPGIFLVDENGQSKGTWRNPVDGGMMCFPNPFNSRTGIIFSTPTATHATVWVSQALGPNEPIVLPNVRYGGVEIFNPLRPNIRVLLAANIPAGQHQFLWGGRDDEGRRAPNGFYRIFALVGEDLLFFDVLLCREGEPCPVNLE